MRIMTRTCASAGTPLTRLSSFNALAQANKASTPASTPASTAYMKLADASASEKVPVSAAATAKRNMTRPDASLSRDSPSRMCISRGGTSVLSTIEDMATASVGDSTAASAKPTASGMLGTIQCKA